MIEYEFNQKKGILETKFVGEVTLTEIINYIIDIKVNKKYPRILKIKTDATKAIFEFSTNDIKRIKLETDNMLEYYDFIIAVMIVSAPKTTAFSMLYKELKKNDKYKFNVFSTERGASQWLENY